MLGVAGRTNGAMSLRWNCREQVLAVMLLGVAGRTNDREMVVITVHTWVELKPFPDLNQ